MSSPLKIQNYLVGLSNNIPIVRQIITQVDQFPYRLMAICRHLLISNVIMVLVPIFALNINLFSNQIQLYYRQAVQKGITCPDDIACFNITSHSPPKTQYSLQQQLKMPPYSRFLLSHCQFDGLQFITNTYQFQPNFAFIKGYTTMIQLVKFIVKTLTEKTHVASPFNHFHTFQIELFVLLLINKLLFCLSALKLRQIVFRLTSDRQKSQIIAILFIYNPACIFFHAIYTESIYSFLTFNAINYALKHKENDTNKEKPDYSDYKSVGLLSLSVFFRTNGIFLSPILGVPILYQLVLKVKQKQTVCSIKLILKGFITLSVIIAPLIIYQVFSFQNLCSIEVDLLNDISLRQQCDKFLPNLYNFVQRKFWSVGFLSYFKPSNSIFILLGSPSLLICLLAAVNKWKSSNLTKVRVCRSLEHSVECGLYLSFVILYIVTLSLANIQSSTRFFASHPAFYLILNNYFSSKLVRFWLFTYFLFGGVLFCIGFPWT